MQHTDVCIAGAGIIGLSLALELARGGARVTVLDRGPALAEASFAAAGMLAADDPHNPPALQSLANLSLHLYPAFLNQIASLSGVEVPFQTSLTLQQTPHPSISPTELDRLLPSHHLSHRNFTLLNEHSVDPRQLASALATAIAAHPGITLLTGTAVLGIHASGSSVAITTAESSVAAAHFVDCTGAWTATFRDAVIPRKGQMLSVALPHPSALPLVLRTEDIYIVPRTAGPGAGRAIIGATVEDAGFSKAVNPADIARLQTQAADLLPDLATAPLLEQWAGLRPATTDELPLLGAHPTNPRHLLATGHFRNGILLAPATAHVMAQFLLGNHPSIDLAPFTPARFTPQPVR